MLTARLSRFLRAEDGAVTVDWVVLTGGLLIFGVLVASLIIAGATDTSDSISAALSGSAVPTVRFE